VSRHTNTTTWEMLATAITGRRAVLARYHERERILCPHALGWKNDRAKVLCFQAVGETSTGWRSMFVDELAIEITLDGSWMTADNYSSDSNCFDEIEIEIEIE
jgi:hypothetical protein